MKHLVFLSVFAFSFHAHSASFETFLGQYSIDQTVCYVNGTPTTEGCTASAVQILSVGKELCVQIRSENPAIAKTQCMSTYRSGYQDHAPNNYYEAYFSAKVDTVSWVKNIAAGSYRSSQVVSLHQKNPELILNLSLTETTGQGVNSNSMFLWLKPRVHILPIKIPGT